MIPIIPCSHYYWVGSPFLDAPSRIHGLGLRVQSCREVAVIRDYNSNPHKGTHPRFRTLLGLITPYVVLISSLNPGRGTFGGGVLSANSTCQTSF